jgi:vacuolar-type H+-ATPase catalytic subunit A/Vma1
MRIGVNGVADTSPLREALLEACIFSEIFVREGWRAMNGNKNQLGQATAQLRACLDKIDKITGASHGD